MCTAGTIAKGELSSRESGSAVIILVGIIMVLLGSIVFLNSHNNVTANNLAGARSKVRGDALASRIHNNLKQLFTAYPGAGGGCLPPALNQNAVLAFRKFGAGPPAPIIVDISGAIPSFTCLYDDDDKKLISSLKIRITEMSEDSNALSRNLNFTVEVGLVKTKNTIDQVFRVIRDYRLRVLSLSQFGVVFHSNPADDTPFVSVDGPAQVRVKSTVLFADSSPPSWGQLQGTDGEKVIFSRNVYSRFPKLHASTALNVQDFRISFPYGIQTGVLSQDFVTDFLPNSSYEGWNNRFDYFPLYNGLSYAIPELPSRPSAGNCLASDPAPDDTRFISSRADVTRIPDVTDGFGPHNLRQTCEDGTRTPAFIFNRADADLTIDMDPNDSNFCGIVVARRLVINLPAGATKYGLIGHFFVNSIVVHSAPGAPIPELRIYNPEENEPTEGLSPLPSGQSLGTLASSFKRLASSSAWNAYVPISQSGVFRTRAPSDYLVACPGVSYSAYNSTYLPIHLLTGFSQYQSDSVNSIYSLESL